MNATPVVATTKYVMLNRCKTPGMRNFCKSIHPKKILFSIFFFHFKMCGSKIVSNTNSIPKESQEE